MAESTIKNPSGPPDLITRQLSTTAQYYPPGVYTGAAAGGLPAFLSFYRDLSITSDPAASGFIPMSAIPSRARNTKLFAIGILPPNMTIDESQLLDRSSVVTNLTGDNATAERIAAITTADAEELIIPRQISTVGVGAIKTFEGNVLHTYRDSVGKLTIGVGHTGPEVVEGLVWTQEQVDAQFAVDIAKFETSVRNAVKVPVTQGQFDAMVSLAFNIGASAFAESTLVRKLNAGDRAGASREFDAWNKVTINGVKQVSASQVSRRGIEQQIFDREALAAANPLPVNADADSATFAGYGSQNANSFRRGLSRQTDLIQTDLLNTQRSYMLAAKRALQAMINTPPLRLLVNPSSFSVKSQKIVSDGNWGRNGPIIEFWGDDQDKISGSGKVAAFYSIDARPQLGRGGPGLTRHARNLSMGWQNLQSLYLLYRNNGGMYLSDMSRQDRDILLTTVGSVYLFYDNILYIGCFDSFTITEVEDQPFTVEYSFEFTVRAAFLLEFAQDFNYGGAAAFGQSTLGSGLPIQSNNTTTAGIADIAAQGGSVVVANDVQGTINSAADFIVENGSAVF